MGKFQDIVSSSNPLSRNDNDAANAQLEQILSACEKRDESAMKALFSKRTIDEAADLDETITALFDFFQGEVMSYDDWGGPGVSAGMNEGGTGRHWKRIRSTYDVETSEQRYRFAIEGYTVHTFDPDSVGISSLYVIKAEDSDLSIAYWGDGKFTPGITIEQK